MYYWSEFITNYSSSIGASRCTLSDTDPAFQYIDFGAYPLDLWNWGKRIRMVTVLSFGSVNYNYDNRYYATVSVRQDASSQFAANNQTATFPSFSAGWRISQEKFMQDVSWFPI